MVIISQFIYRPNPTLYTDADVLISTENYFKLSLKINELFVAKQYYSKVQWAANCRNCLWPKVSSNQSMKKFPLLRVMMGCWLAFSSSFSKSHTSLNWVLCISFCIEGILMVIIVFQPSMVKMFFPNLSKEQLGMILII